MMKRQTTKTRSTAIRWSSPSDNIVWSSGRPSWHRYQVDNQEYISCEADAHIAREWAVLRVPDMLQTPDYTRSLYRTDRVFCGHHLIGTRIDHAGTRRIADEIESREERLTRLGPSTNHPLEYVTVIEEAVLRKVVGDHKIMRDQLLMLVDCAGWSAVTLRVLPEKASAQTGTDGGFWILEFHDPLEKPKLLAHYPGGVVEEQEHRFVEQATQRFNALLAAALPIADSIEFIEQLADQLYPE